MKAEKQHKELQSGLVQSKRERSKLSFVDNRSQTVNQGKLVNFLQKKENKIQVTQFAERINNTIVSTFRPDIVLGTDEGGEIQALLTKITLPPPSRHVMLTLEWYDNKREDKIGHYTQHLTYDENEYGIAVIHRKQRISDDVEEQAASKKRKYLEGGSSATSGIQALVPLEAFSFALLMITKNPATYEYKTLTKEQRVEIQRLFDDEKGRPYIFGRDSGEYTCLTWANMIWGKF